MQIPVEAIIGGATVIGGITLILHKAGLWSFGDKKKIAPGVPAELCKRNHEQLAKDIKSRDERYEEILHSNHTTQELILQRMEQTECRLREGNNNFQKLYEMAQVQNTSVALLNQSMSQVDARVRRLEGYKNGNGGN